MKHHSCDVSHSESNPMKGKDLSPGFNFVLPPLKVGSHPEGQSKHKKTHGTKRTSPSSSRKSKPKAKQESLAAQAMRLFAAHETNGTKRAAEAQALPTNLEWKIRLPLVFEHRNKVSLDTNFEKRRASLQAERQDVSEESARAAKRIVYDLPLNRIVQEQKKIPGFRAGVFKSSTGRVELWPESYAAEQQVQSARLPSWKLPRMPSHEYIKNLDYHVAQGESVPISILEPSEVPGDGSRESVHETKKKVRSKKSKEPQSEPKNFYLSGSIGELSNWVNEQLEVASLITPDASMSLDLDREHVIESICDLAMEKFQGIVSVDRAALLERVWTAMRDAINARLTRAARDENEKIRTEYRKRMIQSLEQQKNEAQKMLQEKYDLWSGQEALRLKLKSKEDELVNIHRLVEKERQQLIDDKTGLELKLDGKKKEVQNLREIQQELTDQVTRLKKELKTQSETLKERELDIEFAQDREKSRTSRINHLEAQLENLKTKRLEQSAQKEEPVVERKPEPEQIEEEVNSSEAVVEQRRRLKELVESGKLPPLPTGLRSLIRSEQALRASPNTMHIIPRRALQRWLGRILLERITFNSEQRALKMMGELLESNYPFPAFVYDLYVSRHGYRDSAELELVELAANLHHYAPESARVRLFRQFLSSTVSNAAVEFCINLYEALREKASGGFQEVRDNSDGVSWVNVKHAVKLCRTLFESHPPEIVDRISEKLVEMARFERQSRRVKQRLQEAAARTAAEDYMELDSCVEVMFQQWEIEDQRRNQTIADALIKFYQRESDPLNEGQETIQFSLLDFVMVIRSIDSTINERRLIRMYTYANQLAYNRAPKLHEYVLAAREGGVLPVVTSFPQDERDQLDTEPSGREGDPAARSHSDRQYLQLLQTRIDALREQVVETNKAWQSRLQRADEKYEQLSTTLKTKYDRMLEEERIYLEKQVDEKVQAIEQAKDRELKTRRNNWIKSIKELETQLEEEKARHKSTLSQFESTSEDYRTQMEELHDGIRTLAMRLHSVKDQSMKVSDDVLAQTKMHMETLQEAVTLRSRDLDEMRLEMERSKLAQEDLRARTLRDSKRLFDVQKENSMLRRTQRVSMLSKKSSKPSSTSSRSQSILVNSLPPVSQIQFGNGDETNDRRNDIAE